MTVACAECEVSETWDASSSKLAIDYGLGSLATNEYEESGEYTWGRPCKRRTDPLGRETSFTYYDGTNSAVAGKMEVVTDPAGIRTKFEYTTRGDPLQITRYEDAAWNEIAYVTNSYVYFTNGVGWEAQLITSQVCNADGELLAQRVIEYTCDNRSNGDPWDDVYLLSSVRGRTPGHRCDAARKGDRSSGNGTL